MESGEKNKLLKKLEILSARMIAAVPGGRKNGKPRKADIFLLGDTEMKRIKKKFLPLEKGPANVLSFAEPSGWPHPEGGPGKLGEIYINLGLTKGRTEEIAPLLAHGILHLLGYDHKKKNDRIKMENMEKRILLKASA